jgi:hypothetical protein
LAIIEQNLEVEKLTGDSVQSTPQAVVNKVRVNQSTGASRANNICFYCKKKQDM